MGVGVDDGVDQGRQPGGDEQRTGDVELGRRGRAAHLAQVEHRADHHGDADGDVDEEHPAPGQLGGQDAAEQRSDGPAGPTDRTPHAEGLGQPGTLEGGDDDGERGRRPQRPAEALGHPGAGEHPRRGGEAADEAGHGEQRRPGDEHLAPAEEVGRPAAEQQEPGEGQHIGVHHPLQAGGRVVEVLADRREGDVHHRDVEDDHELRHAGERQDDPVVVLVGAHRPHHVPRTVSGAGLGGGAHGATLGAGSLSRGERGWCSPR